MKKILLTFFVIVSLCVFACSTKEQAELSEGETTLAGVNFEKLSLQDAMIKAENQNKLIMIDFFSPT